MAVDIAVGQVVLDQAGLLTYKEEADLVIMTLTTAILAELHILATVVQDVMRALHTHTLMIGKADLAQVVLLVTPVPPTEELMELMDT